ncbi:phosphatidylethanolamine N-methyltransferase isoform X2 [Anarhichas minor]|uniref:phosphatidylethanolamine N-methyltransferase isoform X2 n=1 Tax=Anarhichas minor TaxID=65739 RepID=UPI003F73EBAE
MSDVAAVQDDNPAGETRSVPLDCCGGLNNVDYSKMDLTLIEGLLKHTNFHDSSFYLAVVAIVFNPFFWNVVARWEHRTRTLSRLFGSPYLACYCLGFVIVLLNVYRSHSMTVAMKSQAKWEVMDRTDVFYAGVALMVLGTVLVVGSFLALGFTGTFLVCSSPPGSGIIPCSSVFLDQPAPGGKLTTNAPLERFPDNRQVSAGIGISLMRHGTGEASKK